MTEKQQLMLARRYGLFIHFGLNTFIDIEWGDGRCPSSVYRPDRIDTDNWVETAKLAGMTYVVLAAKHHDGFCLWPSEHTDYSVRHSADDTDVLASVAESCAKFGIEFGLYYSLWDRHWNGGVMRAEDAMDIRDRWEMPPGESERYVEYMRAQLEEIMSAYGEVCELWLDGGWVQTRDRWNIPAVYETVAKHQPRCCVGVNWTIGAPGDPDRQSVLPENQREGYPIRYFPSDFRLADPYLPANPDPKYFDHEGTSYYLPFEATVCLNENWFFNTGDSELKSLDELKRIYNAATAQHNNLVLNSPPDREGVMPARNRKRLAELRAALG